MQIDLVPAGLEVAQALAVARVIDERCACVEVRDDEQRGAYPVGVRRLESELDLVLPRG